MTSKTIVKMTVMFSFFIFLTTFDMSINKAFGQNCANTPATNEAIVNDLYEKIKGNKSLEPQISHINITSTNLAIKIRGWADTQADYDKIFEYAMESNCGTKANLNEFYVGQNESLMPGPGCSGGTKPCGDICIPDNDVCNIKG